jgi:hypothetical protein
VQTAGPTRVHAGVARWLDRLLLGVLLLFLVWTSVRGVNEIEAGANFGVFSMAAEIAVEAVVTQQLQRGAWLVSAGWMDSGSLSPTWAKCRYEGQAQSEQ